MKQNNIYLILAILLFILTLWFTCHRDSFTDEFDEFIKEHVFYDENNNIINHKQEENVEQYQAFKYISPGDIVLELGGRYGTVSVVINKKVTNKMQHVVVEPDENVIMSLKKNIDKHNCSCEILPKFISNKNKKIVYGGYGTFLQDSTDKNENQITYAEFKRLYPQQFNVLVADCEGCLYEFLEMMGADFNHLNKVIFEADQVELCNYDEVKKKLINNGFKEVDNINNFRFVYIK